MTYLLWAILVIGWLGTLAGLIYFGIWVLRDSADVGAKFMAGGAWLFAAGLFVAPLAYLTTDHSQDKPCVRYETTYVLVGKVMTPMRYCAEYGP